MLIAGVSILELLQHLLSMNSKLSTKLAELILDASVNAIFVGKAIWDELGNISDFEITHANKAFTRIIGYTHEQAVGNRYLTLFPYTLDNGMFKINCEVVKTGIPQHTET